MRTGPIVVVISVLAALGGFVVPSLAQDSGGMGRMPDQGMTMDHGIMGHRMMGQGAMGGGMQGMMSGGCAGMMRSMAGGDGRPNSQWRTHPRSGAVPD